MNAVLIAILCIINVLFLFGVGFAAFAVSCFLIGTLNVKEGERDKRLFLVEQELLGREE